MSVPTTFAVQPLFTAWLSLRGPGSYRPFPLRAPSGLPDALPDLVIIITMPPASARGCPPSTPPGRRDGLPPWARMFPLAALAAAKRETSNSGGDARAPAAMRRAMPLAPGSPPQVGVRPRGWVGHRRYLGERVVFDSPTLTSRSLPACGHQRSTERPVGRRVHVSVPCPSNRIVTTCLSAIPLPLL